MRRPLRLPCRRLPSRARLGARLRGERGVALITTIIVLGTLTIAGTSIVAYSSAGSRTSSLSAASQKAYSLAEAGMNFARSTLYEAASYSDPNAVPQRTVPMNGGTVSYSGSLSGSTWTLTGVGSVPNPTGPGTAAVTRTVSSRVTVTTALQSSPNNGVWNYMYADNPSSCVNFTNNTAISAALYSRGDLCLSNSAQITGPAVHVLGEVYLNNPQSKIGSSGSPVTEVHVSGGCSYRGGPLHRPCGATDNVWATASDTTPGTYTKPPIDLAYWYANAKPGPRQNCTQGSFPGGFDNDGTMNRSRGSVYLLPSTAYDCRVTDTQGTLLGQLTWSPGQGQTPGTLVVNGTIFIDGDVFTNSNAYAVYQGKGTIYASGQMELTNNSKICAIGGCDAGWDPGTNLLVMVAGSPNDGEGFSIRNNARFQGAVYAVSDYRSENNATVYGPVIADEIEINNHVHHDVHIGELIAGMPATYTQAPALVNVQGSYTG